MIKIYIPHNNHKNCIYREQAFSAVHAYYSSIEDFEVKILSSTPFSRSAARNAIFEDRVDDRDIIFFSDADIITPENQIREAVEKSRVSDEMVLAYTLLYKMNVDETNQYIKSKILKKSKKSVKFQCSGSFAISVKLFKEIGGYDERFNKWGCEDRIFYYLANFHRGKEHCERLKGDAFHLYHPISKNANRKSILENKLFLKYLDALGISLRSLQRVKRPEEKKLIDLKKTSLNGAKKEIIPFKNREILRFRKDRKVVVVIKNSEEYQRLIESNEYTCEGALI